MRKSYIKRKIPLTKGKQAIVDMADYEEMNKRKWCAHRGDKTSKPRYYACRKRNGRKVMMHREIMNCPEGMEVDHINGDTLDNRRANLRICSHLQNTHNCKGRHHSTSQYKGVCYRTRYGKWVAQIGFMNGKKHIGYFAIEVLAAKAYDDRAKELFGEFARLNFPNRLRRRNIYRWLMATNGRVFALIFIKRSTGEEKKIHARVGVKTKINGKGLRYNTRDKKLIVVYDMKGRIYKSIPIEGIEVVCCRGKRYRVD